jgi:hypothetical protein
MLHQHNRSVEPLRPQFCRGRNSAIHSSFWCCRQGWDTCCSLMVACILGVWVTDSTCVYMRIINTILLWIYMTLFSLLGHEVVQEACFLPFLVSLSFHDIPQFFVHHRLKEHCQAHSRSRWAKYPMSFFTDLNCWFVPWEKNTTCWFV